MRIFYIIMLLLPGFAQAYPCPTVFDTRPEPKEVHEFLSRYVQQEKLGDCQIEIILCDPSAERWVEGPIAELLIIDGQGMDAYVSIFYPDEDTYYLETKTQLNQQMLNYRKKDRFYEEENGRTEVDRLEILRDVETKALRSIDLGQYRTNRQLNQPNGNDSRWYNCEE